MKVSWFTEVKRNLAEVNILDEEIFDRYTFWYWIKEFKEGAVQQSLCGQKKKKEYGTRMKRYCKFKKVKKPEDNGKLVHQVHK